MRIHRLRDAFASSYLIETHSGLFLVDAGFLGHERIVARKVASLGRSMSDLALALVTHGHPDHVGGLSAMQRTTQLPVACHARHEDAIAEGLTIVSPGMWWGSRVYERVALLAVPLMGLGRVSRTVALADGERLDGFGLAGRAVHTPGHSTGCISLLLDDDTAFVGDLAQGSRIPGVTPIERPSMAEHPELVLGSWRKLLAQGARRFYPAHGSPFTAEDLVARIRVLESRGLAPAPLHD